VKNGIWIREKNRGTEIKGKTFGIIGYGNMGKAVAQRLSGFGVEVLFHDVLPNLSNEFAKQVSLEELQEKADFLSLHMPYSEESKNYINEKFISQMKKNFYLINTARGQHVKTKNLVEALKTGKILGAALDVLEYEKSSFENIETENPDLQYLLNSEKVLITPHIAGWTIESKEKLAQVIVDKILEEFSV
jgi:D-3-phosphoglycerate dehydrogenase